MKIIDTLFQLFKVRLVGLVLLSTLAGYYLGFDGPWDLLNIFLLMLGVGLNAGGSMALNEWMERDEDALMTRTQGRPIPAGIMKPTTVLVIGLIFCFLGLMILLRTQPFIAAVLTAITLITYLFMYTPLKKITSLNTIVGAIPGAIPPMVGWVAATGSLDYEAWVLFCILFLWQLPHFLSIAWVCREEYEKAGFVMLTLEEGKEGINQKIILYTVAIVPVSLLPTFVGMSGFIYFLGAFGLGIYFSWHAFKNLKDLNKSAKPFFFASIIYLSLLLILMVLDKQ